MAKKHKTSRKKITYNNTFRRAKILKVKEVNQNNGYLNLPLVSNQSTREISLLYAGKDTSNDIFNRIPLVSLEEVKTIGQGRFDQWSNQLISGDNLSVLKNLLTNSNVAGKVRLVYIDPPFSTNQKFRSGDFRTATISASDKDMIAYEDNLIGPEYLEFLRQRLILLRELLATDGSIYLHIDTKIGHYVKVLMDEIFGRRHFINDITRIKCNPKNFARKGYGNIKDVILFYSKSNHYVWSESRERLSEEDAIKLFPKIDKAGRRYTTTPIHAPGETVNGATGKAWNGMTPPKGRHWRVHPDELAKLDKKGLIEWSSTGNPRKKIYLDDVLAKGKKRQDIWEFKDSPYPYYPTEKNLEMLKVIINASSNPDDLVLDCFAGSGTTLLAAEELKRRWIGIDNSPVAIKTIQTRLATLKDLSAFTLYETKLLRKATADEQVDSEKHHARQLARLSG